MPAHELVNVPYGKESVRAGGSEEWDDVAYILPVCTAAFGGLWYHGLLALNASSMQQRC
jgi:hypothetical protein